MAHADRFRQAVRNAVKLADAAYEKGDTLGAKATAYYETYRREMAAFDQLEAMRWPHPNQTEIDAQSAELLVSTGGK
jgi:hypothetical protein